MVNRNITVLVSVLTYLVRSDAATAAMNWINCRNCGAIALAAVLRLDMNLFHDRVDLHKVRIKDRIEDINQE